MLAYKLLRMRKNGTLGPLFINARQVIPIGIWLKAGKYRTKNYAYRPGWHTTSKPEAPHLSMKGRIWAEVSIGIFTPYRRPPSQGGVWFIAQYMKVNKLLTGNYGNNVEQDGGKKVRKAIRQATLNRKP